MSPMHTQALLEHNQQLFLGDELNNGQYGSPNGKKGGSSGGNSLMLERFAKTDSEAINNMVKNHPLNKQKQVQQNSQEQK